MLDALYSDVEKESEQDNRHHHHFWTIRKPDREVNKMSMNGFRPVISDLGLVGITHIHRQTGLVVLLFWEKKKVLISDETQF